MALREAACHAHDLQAAILEVVCFFSVQRQDPVRQRFIRGDQRSDLFQTEGFDGGQPMPPVRRPQPIVLAAHDDDGIQKRSRFVDFLREPLRMRGRQIPLERCRLNGGQRQRRKQ